MRELLHEDKPWGGYDRYTLNEVSTVKIIRVAPGSRLSLQRHKEREELWVALDEGLEVEIAGESPYLAGRRGDYGTQGCGASDEQRIGAGSPNARDQLRRFR